MKFDSGILWDIFANVNEQLRFAEAKNGALLTVNTGVTVGLGALVITTDKLPADVRAAACLVLLPLIIGALIAVWSFRPIMNPPRPTGMLNPNVIFFGDIATLDPAEFLSILRTKGNISEEITDLHRDIAGQIVTNAWIATKKFAAFSSALRITGVLLLVSTVAAIMVVALW